MNQMWILLVLFASSHMYSMEQSTVAQAKKKADAEFLKIAFSIPYQNRLALLETAVAHGADVNATDVFGRGIAHLLCPDYLHPFQIRNNPYDAFSYIIHLPQSLLAQQDIRTGNTVLHLLAQNFEYPGPCDAYVAELIKYKKSAFEEFARTIVNKAPSLTATANHLGQLPVDLLLSRTAMSPEPSEMVTILKPRIRPNIIIGCPALLDAALANTVPLFTQHLKITFNDKHIWCVLDKIKNYHERQIPRIARDYARIGRTLIHFLEVKKIISKLLLTEVSHLIAWHTINNKPLSPHERDALYVMSLDKDQMVLT